MPLSADVHSSVCGETFYVSVSQFAGSDGNYSGCSLEFRKCAREKAWRTVKTTVLLCLVHAVTCTVLVSYSTGYSNVIRNTALPLYNAIVLNAYMLFRHVSCPAHSQFAGVDSYMYVHIVMTSATCLYLLLSLFFSAYKGEGLHVLVCSTKMCVCTHTHTHTHTLHRVSGHGDRSWCSDQLHQLVRLYQNHICPTHHYQRCCHQ